MVHPKTS